ncbi:4-hydroxy-tetrahydrodipicolinate synthase [Actinotignum urinale]|uniref:4-hydroxy-tetrahydrodipicolinate synthase n=1 Tax=Actinotignum urinale TaxID=190146 RepID=A0AAW9HMJ9_9ACTO|nr:4-hydroxy-tetrahydrodipicolinate synthase [Actinotignum urinale]MDY5129155.1 4-hydroxy-tetrahydrodipicolinate synthase [Actinotignum urinale]MDY5151449.1 4-hydroxy-tetrahydrodipicolinate synthase [Actinotignum urinale]MDY5154972.1 4-hydroxy-tetrahydrodipicolinate synthase [Actinotignum urinale]
MTKNNLAVSRTFGSVGVAMVTPFHPDGSLDVDSAVKLAVKLVDDGADTILLSGTTGESPTTHQPEKNELVKEVKSALGDRALVMAGAGSNDTAHAIRIAQGSAEAGADRLLVVAPYYNRPSQEGVYQHIIAVAESTDLPVMIYDIPGRTGVKLELDTLKRLAQHPRIKAVKDSTGDVAAGFIKMAETGLEYYSGDDDLNFAWLAHGASGVISVAGHVISSRLRALVQEVDAGDLPAARKEAFSQRSIIRAIMGTGQGAVMAKEALKLTGVLESATLRLPLVGASASQIAALADVLRAEGLIQA